jgi:drug/metabolite transporter (DMT)-like permease
MDNTLATVLLSLATALCWGSSDFHGGLASRRSPAFSVLIGACTVGFVVLTACALIWRESLPAPLDLLWATLAGLAGGLGMAALYSALSLGQMGIVAPVSAVFNATLPAIFGAVTQVMPGPLQLSGFVLALLAIILISRPQRTREPPRGIGLALLAGGSLGCYYIILSRVSHAQNFWPLSVVLLTSVLLWLAIGRFQRLPLLPERKVAHLVVLTGVLTALGNICFLRAEHTGQLAIASILSSLYPAATVFLAVLVLRERVNRLQAVGIVLALVAVGLISV